MHLALVGTWGWKEEGKVLDGANLLQWCGPAQHIQQPFCFLLEGWPAMQGAVVVSEHGLGVCWRKNSSGF